MASDERARAGGLRPKKGPSASRDIAVALTLVAPVAFVVFGIATHSEKLLTAIRFARRAPDGVALVLGGAAGFSLAVFVASVVWLLRRRSSRPWGLALLPASVVAAVGYAVDRVEVRPALAAADVAARPFDDRVMDLAATIALASPTWTLSLLLVAALLAGGSLAIGIRARLHDRVGSQARPIAAIIVGAILIVAIPMLGTVFLRHLVGSSALTSSWMALLPSTIGVVSVFLAARGASVSGDGLIGAAFAMLSVIAFAFATAAGDLSLFGDTSSTPEDMALFAAVLEPDQRAAVWVTMLALLPIVVAALIVNRSRHLRVGFPRAAPIIVGAAVTLTIGFAAMHSSARAMTASLATLWMRQLPPGIALPPGEGEDCEGLVVSEIVAIGPASITRAGQLLAPTTDLDTEAGCAAFVLELDHALRSREGSTNLRLAIDPQIGFGRVECLARALASSALRDAKASRTVRRRPRCVVQALTSVDREHRVPPFPQCTTLHIASEECVPPQAVTPVVATSSRVFTAQNDGTVTVESIATLTVEDANGYAMSSPLLLSATPTARFSDVVTLPRRLQHERRGYSATTSREAWLLPADLSTPAMLAMIAPPRFDATEIATARASGRVASGIDQNAIDATFASASDRLAACQVFGAGTAASRSGATMFRLLVGADGAVGRVWINGAPGGPLVVACVSRVLSELHFPAPGAPAPAEPTILSGSLGARIVRARVAFDEIDAGGAVSAAERAKIVTAIRSTEIGIRSCYEGGLRRDPRLTGTIPVRMMVTRGKVTMVYADAPFEAAVSKCTLDLLRALAMPTVASGDYGMKFNVRLAPPMGDARR